VQYPKPDKLCFCCVFAAFFALLPTVQAGISFSLTGPTTASICDTLNLTNTINNTGGVLGGLYVTNTLPGANFSYVFGETVIQLPDGSTLTGAAADPVTNGLNLSWDFSNITTPSSVNNILITEVFYNATNSTKESYQWIELFNPTTNPIVLNNWKVKDVTPGTTCVLPNMTIEAGEFVIVAGLTNAFYATHGGIGSYTGKVFQVSEGRIGNGLNDYGDGVLLLNASSATVDGMSYGNATTPFPLACELVMTNQSIARTPAANTDNGTRTDWATMPIPEPGFGDLPVGMQGGAVVTIRYKVAGSCSAATGQFSANATYNQPPSDPPANQSASASVTLNRGDLTISKTPLTQSAGRYDLVGWAVTVKNVGVGNARNVVITDRLSSGFGLTNCSVAPASISTNVAGKVITWDGSVIPELADLAPDQSVTVAVTGRVDSVSDLSNKADARWGCTTNSSCEDSVNVGETVTAGLTLIDRVPKLAGWLTPASPLSVPYCGGTNLVLHITNGVGITVGAAYSVVISNTLPAGWSLSGPEVDINGVIHAGDIPAGGSTNLAFTLIPGGTCPIFTNLQTTYFTFSYHDATDRTYGPPTLYTAMQVVQEPAASVLVSVPPSQTATTNGLIPVEVYFSYSNFTSNELITLRNTFPVSAELTPTNISAGGFISGPDVVWTNSGLTGSGVYTARFDLAIGDVCAVPVGYINNIITVPDFTNCQSCSTPVTGSGESYRTYLSAGVGCPQGGGGTGGCSYASIKTAPTNLIEVYRTVFLSHTFTNFSGTLPGWSNMTFTSDLGGNFGELSSTTDVTVTVNGSNLTSFCSISATSDLQVVLTGLSDSIYPDLASVTNLTVTWGMWSIAPGLAADRSVLNVPACGSAAATVYWNVGASALSVSLNAIQYLEACGVATGRIDLAQLSSPGLQSGSNAVFPAYNVRVVLDLDADGNHDSMITYEPNSTAFSNMVLLGGAPTNGFDPEVTTTQLVWNIGNLDPNGAGFITYVLRGACSRTALEKQVARVEYNSYVPDGYPSIPQLAVSVTNAVPTVAPAGNLVAAIQPEVTFLTDTQYVVRLSFLNTGAGNAYNVTPELILPPNVVFQSASITNCTVTSTSVVWNLQDVTNPGDLIDADHDGFMDDLRPVGQFEIYVTNSVTGFTPNAVHAAVSHGCNNTICQSATSPNATFESNAGALIARTSFAANGKLCQSNEVQISVWNSGLIRDYDVHIMEVLPAGMSYVPGSSRYVYGVTTNPVSDPVASASNLTWSSSQIAPFAGLEPDGRVTILFQTLAACAASTSACQYSTSATYRDISQNLVPVASVAAIQGLDLPVLTMGVTASSTVVDYNQTNIYTLTIDHSGASTVDVPAMQLEDVLSDKVTFLGASVPPDYTNGTLLVWSNSTLMALASGSPYTPANASISITVTTRVNECNDIINNATVRFGCDQDSLCLNTPKSQTSISVPLVTVGDGSALTLNTWGGTRAVVVTNTGATARNVFITNTAPDGFVFTTVASVSGEYSGTPIVTLGGSPLGKTAVINFTSDASSGVTDLTDDAGDGSASLDLGNRKGIAVTFNLISDGSGMDVAASPLDWGYADLEPIVSSRVYSPAYVTFINLCAQISATPVTQTASAIPSRPEPDISLTPQSIVLTNGQVVGFIVNVVNGGDAGLTTNLHVRLQLGAGWSNLVCVDTQIVQTGSGALAMEMMGSTNVLIDMPGFALDPVDDHVRLDFQATVVQGAGSLAILAEVVGITPVAPIGSYTYVGTNTFGASPLANTMTGTTVSAVGGAYYGFDQCQMSGAGFEITKTVRYAGQDVSAGVNELNARIGEPLIFHIRANFFGTSYSNVVLTQSHETNFIFAAPAAPGFTGEITNYTYDATTGEFQVLPVLFDGSSSALFDIDVPVTVRNQSTNLTGMTIPNIVVPDFYVVGMTNTPPSVTNFVHVVEPELGLSLVSDTNNVQAGDIVTFTNVISHVAGSNTNAYDIVFVSTLPDGMTFTGVNQVSPGITNGDTFTATSVEIPELASLAQGASVTIVVRAKVMNQLVGSTIFNTSTIQYTSLSGSSADERDGSDGIGFLNDYIASESLGILAIPLTGISKSVGASSESYTEAPDLTIGERILYTLHVDVPNGVSTNLQITDQLPPGLDWVGSNSSAGLAFPGVGYQISIPANGPVFSTNEGAGLTVTDSDPTRGESLNLDGSAKSVRFTIAIITNTPDENALNDYFDITLQCVVLDDSVNNTGKSSNQKSWSNQVTVADGFATNTTNSVAYRIVEPDVKIGHALSPVSGLDAGDTVTVTLFVTNSASALANAYDVTVLDTFPLAYINLSSLVLETPESGWVITTDDSDGINFKYSLATTSGVALPPNTVVTNRFSFNLSQAVTPNLTLSNAFELVASDTINGAPPAGIPWRSTTSTKTYRTLTVTNMVINKTFVGTSETNAFDSTSQKVQIGETVTYKLTVTLPEGTISNLVVTDLMPAGMQYVTNRLSTNDLGGSLGAPVGVVGGTGNGVAVSLVFSNNTVVTTNNLTTDNSFSIDVDAVVLNVAGNTGKVAGAQTVFTNKAVVSYAGNPLAAVTNGLVLVTNVEPKIAISKSFSTNLMDAGDVVRVTLVVSNTGLATAYDLVVTDAMNTVYFDTNTVTNFKVNGQSPTGYVQTLVGSAIWIVSDTNNYAPPYTSLETNEVVTFAFDVTAAQSLAPNTVVTNRAWLSADTISGYALNQRTVTGSVATAIIASTNLVLAKSFIGTSETNGVDSTSRNMQIGETVTYQIRVTMPEGTLTNLTVWDKIPVGMQYVTNRVDTNGFAGTLPALTVVGSATNGSLMTFGFAGNTVVTGDNETTSNRFDLYVDALSLDVAGNVQGRVATNTAWVSFTNNPQPAFTNGLVLTTNVVPVIGLTKTFSTNLMDAGDVVWVTLVVTNTGLATAYDLVVTDAVNTVFFDTNSSVASFTVNGQAPTGYVMSAISGGFLIVSDTNNTSAPTNTLEINEGITFRYSMAAAQTIPPNSSVSLTASFKADTMSGTPAQQRIVSAVDASASVSTPNISIIKSLVGTSLTHDWESAATNLQIGETATYRIEVTLPEGTITNLVVTDLIPIGMKYLDCRVYPSAQMSVGASNAVSGMGNGDPVVITFVGNTVVGSNNITSDNILAIEVDARVMDVPLNRGTVGQQTVFTNQATAVFSGLGANTVTSSKVYAWAVEPALRMLKSMTGPVNGLVTISLVVTNEGLATAYDVVVTDRLDSAYFYTSTLSNTFLPAGFSFASAGAPGAATITLTSGADSMLPTNAIKAGEAASFMFTVQSVPNAGRSITNVAVIVSNSTLSGVSANERVEPVTSGTNVLALPMSTITKTVISPIGRAADVGETVSYLIAVTNLGSGGLSNVVVTDDYPTNYITYLNATPTPQTVLAGGSLVWSNVGPLAVGGGTNITVNFRALHNTYPGVMTNLVSSSVLATNGASPAMIYGSVTNAIVPSYALSKTVLFPAGRSAVTNGPATFVMTVTNSGDIPLTSIRLDDSFDTNVLLITSAAGATYSAGQGSLVWTDLGGLAVGGVASVTGNFTALTSTGSGKTTNTVVSSATFTNGLVTLKTNAALLQVTIPVGLVVTFTNTLPPESNVTFQISTVTGAVYHVISVSNNIDHPDNQDWRLMVTWSNMPSWVTYKDSNVVQEVNNTRFYQIVWEEAGVIHTNPVMYEAFVQNMTTGWWHELAMPVECFDYELNNTMGDKLKVGLRGDNVDGDLMYALMDDGVTWRTYKLYGNNKWVREGEAIETTDRISPKSGYWVKRMTGGVSTNIEYVGPVRLTSETNTFLPGKWKMISWPFPRARTEAYNLRGTDIGWGFNAAGAHGDMNWENADRLYVSSGLTTIILYMRPDGRWYKVGQNVPAGNTVRLQHGVGYYYYHSGTGMVWAAESPTPNSNWW
jgi:uncharacterized repeat protein (TIGR01451 family)